MFVVVVWSAQSRRETCERPLVLSYRLLRTEERDMMKVLLVMVAWTAAASAQFFPQELPIAIQPPPLQQPLVYQQFQQPQPLVQAAVGPQQQNYAHRAVLQNAAAEAQLPAHLTNPFYKNSRIANALAKESWFTPGENLVVDREAEKIPRQRIYQLLKHAALIRRRR